MLPAVTQVSPPRPAEELTRRRSTRPRHAAPTRRRFGLDRRAVAYCVAVFAVSRGLMVLLALIVPVSSSQASLGWFQRLVAVGDAGWYLTIARGGYAHLAYHLVQGQENWPFFPLFPVASRWIAELLGAPVLWVGLALANACFFGFLLALYRWLASDWTVRAARFAVVLAAFVPVSPYFVEVRAGPMFLLLSALCLERTVHRRLGQAAVLGALASLCRPTGIVLALPYLVACCRVLRDRRSRRAGLASLGGTAMFAVGPLVMAGVSRAATGNALAFLQVQSWWGRYFRLPFAPFVSFAQHPTWLSDWGWASPPIALVAAMAGIVATYYLWRRGAPAELSLYLLAVVLAGSASTVLFGYPRFVAEAVPLYVAGGIAPRRAAVPLVALSVAGLVAYTVAWLVGIHWTMG